MKTIDQTAVNTLRFLSVDAVEKANSGHPGFPLGTAPLMYTLWDRFINYNPQDPHWFNRDRFILSPGHGSALLYSMLHLAGFDLSLDEIKKFRQWGSKTPGHPEYGHTAGVEASTGPLGHGFAMGVGFAIAETMLAAQYNQKDFEVINHYTYGLTSDGDLMEGVASEAASLAGTLGLGKLIYLYDDNKITIEGSTDIAFNEDVAARFIAYGWQVLRVASSEDIEGIAEAVRQAQQDTTHPSLIIIHTHIGFGSPKQDSPAAHGEPLGAEALAKTKEAAGWPMGKSFYVPETVKTHFNAKRDICAKKQKTWEALMADYAVVYPELATELTARIAGEAMVNLGGLEKVFNDVAKTSTREASGEILQKLAMQLPGLVGGSADLGPSNKTTIKGGGFYSVTERSGKNIHFGVREHAMGKIVNGMALHGGFIPYGGTFLVFADFMRPAVRMAALMGIRAIFVFTHDSIALGEDGPTHQPIEQTMSLRMIPGLSVFRPADALETATAWQAAVLNSNKPTALLLSRQKLTVLHEYKAIIHKNASKGGYILNAGKSTCQLDAVLLATGSEVHLALAAQKVLAEEAINVSVVSLPSWDHYDAQSKKYKETVMPSGVPRIAVEAGVSFGWSRYTGNENNIIGIDKFGASAPGDVVYEKYGFTVKNVVAKVKHVLK
ncbi:MAG: transketolase [Acidaminococcaceae bacterium]